MPVLLANPLGLLALLGIPAILLIHFLQRQSRRFPASTLFLLDHLQRESVKGRRFDRLRQSVPLWLQLLAVLLLAWILAEPRWASTRSVQRIVLVLDDSASMDAFRDGLLAALRRELPPLSTLVGTTEYTALESSSQGETLHRGTSLGGLLDALADWRPAAGSHSPEAALRVARGLAGAEGLVVLATDHPGDPLPFGALRLAVGQPLDNVGFAGVRIEEGQDGELLWRATLRNYGSSPQRREWFLAADGRRSEARTVDLAPGTTRTLQGPFPEDAARLLLVLEPDAFPRDDRLHLVRPSPKPLLVARATASAAEPLVTSLLASLEAAVPPPDDKDADLWFATYNPLAPAPVPEQAVVLLHQPQPPRRFLDGPLVASAHPLVAELDWQGLIARSSPGFPPDESDLPLVWQGERPLVILRESGVRRQLLLNFDVLASNAPRLPAFVILVHRFAERLREAKVGPESRNLELGQPLALAHRGGEGSAPLILAAEAGRENIPPARARLLRAPREPGFFQILQDEAVLLDASANFADVREADFREAGSLSELGTVPAAVRERQTQDDPARSLWLLLLATALLASWAHPGRKPRDESFPA
jgi:hypothetical protein